MPVRLYTIAIYPVFPQREVDPHDQLCLTIALAGLLVVMPYVLKSPTIVLQMLGRDTRTMP